MRIEAQANAIVFRQPLRVEIELGMPRDGPEIEDSRLNFIRSDARVLLREVVLHQQVPVIQAQVAEIGSRVIPNFFIDKKVVLAIRLRDRYFTDVREIRDRGTGLRRIGDHENRQ